MPNILPLIQDLVKLYGNITAPPTTPPPSPPPSTQPGTEPRMGYDDPFLRSPPLAYPPFFGYGYGAWWRPPFGPPAVYVMPPVWPYYQPSFVGVPVHTVGTSQPTATTVHIVPANIPSSGPSYYERGHERTTMGDDGKEKQWWWNPRYGDILKRDNPLVRPSPWTLALAVQGYPLNEAAREQYRQYVEEFMKERYRNYDLRKALEVAKNPPQWHMELWEKYGGEPEWHKEHRRQLVETLPALIEKYQPEPPRQFSLRQQPPTTQPPAAQPPATQSQLPTPQQQVLPAVQPIWEWHRGGREI